MGLGQMVNKLRDVLGFRSSNSAAPPGASGGSSTANTGGLKPPDVTAPGSTFSGDTSEADSKGFPGKSFISCIGDWRLTANLFPRTHLQLD